MFSPDTNYLRRWTKVKKKKGSYIPFSFYLRAKGRKRGKEYFIPVVYCRYCKKYTVVELTTFFFKKDKRVRFESAHCINCEYVLNVDRNINVRWLSVDELESLGWKEKKK